MDDECRTLLLSAMHLINDYQAILGDFLPVVRDISIALSEGHATTDDQTHRWLSLHGELTTRLAELAQKTGAIARILNRETQFDA